MMRWFRRVSVSVFVLLFFSSLALAAGGNFVSSSQVDISLLLAPPSAAGSAETTAELAEMKKIQENRTPEQLAAAQADAKVSVFQSADVLGPKFTAENLPKADAFFKKLDKNEGDLIYEAKEAWKRPRPFQQSEEIKACAFVHPGSPSYPSGHATFAYMNAVILSNMLPEKKAEIFARATRYARNRVICGVHFPSDVEAGRISGTVIAAFMLQSPAFKDEYAGVKAEIRKVLGFE